MKQETNIRATIYTCPLPYVLHNIHWALISAKQFSWGDLITEKSIPQHP